MTISSTNRKAGPFAGNGVTVTFPFAFKVFAAADVLVVLAEDGSENTLTLDVDYSIALNVDQNANPGGLVTTNTAYSSDYTITLTSALENLQPVVLTNAGGFYPRVINDALDRVTILLQQVAERASRALTLPISSSGSGSLPAPSPSAFIGWDSLGQNLVNYAGVTTAAVSAFMSGVMTSANALAARVALGLGTDATGTNLSALTNAVTSRANLGLGTAATLTAGVADGNVVVVQPDGKLPALDGSLLTGISVSPPVRQTVLSGPVDSNGYAAFGGATGSTTVTATGTIKATAAAGGDANRTGSIVNPSWTGLSTNGAMYLYMDIDAAGVITTGSTTLNRIEQWGGTYSTTNGQNTYNIQEMTMKVGNGSSAIQVYRVFVGEVTVSGGVVTAITWYALMGRYESAWTNTLPGANTAISSNHNIGITPRNKKLVCECLTTEGGYLVGDVAVFCTWAGSYCTSTDSPWVNRTSVGFTTGATTAFAGTTKNTLGGLGPTAANWKYKFTADRGW